MLRMDNDEKFQFTSHMLHVILLFLCFFLKTQLFPHDYARDDIVRNFFEIPETVLTVLHYVFLFFFFFFLFFTSFYFFVINLSISTTVDGLSENHAVGEGTKKKWSPSTRVE